jgi:DNA polymerase IIIc chi subunit
MSQTINFYQTEEENLCKAVCLVLGKCYEQGFKTLVVTKDASLSVKIDNLLWTCVQKSFIPHALISDPLVEQHPIIITDSLLPEGDLHFNALVLVERFALIGGNFQKTMLFFARNNKDQAMNLMDKNSNLVANYYIQNDKAGWDLGAL